MKNLEVVGKRWYFNDEHKLIGNVVPKVKTSGKRLRSKLSKVNLWARKVRNMARLPVIWKTFQAKLAGHIRYYGVSFNAKRLDQFLAQATYILFKWLNRRSQRKSFNWEQFNCFMQKFPLPRVKIYHPLYGPTAV